MWDVSYRVAKRIVVLVIGVTLLLVGVCMFVLPGPGILVVFLGLTVLAGEFVWARRWLEQLKDTTKKAGEKARGWWWKRKST
jgi:tellurite resistance protein TerC